MFQKIDSKAAHIALFAGFWQRAGALLMDGFLVSIPIYLIALAFSNDFDRNLNNQQPPDENIFHLIRVITGWLYFSLFESSAYQATPGKMIFRIFISSNAGIRQTFFEATVRYFAKIISIVFAGIGCLLALITKRKQTFHDITINSVVLKKSPIQTELAGNR